MSDAQSQQTAKEGVVYDKEESKKSRLMRLLRPFWGFWYVHPDVTLLVYATPAVCLGTLVTSAKPSTERLDLRNLFAHGRRYHFVGGSLEGFRMETTSKVPWRRRRERTPANATLSAKFQPLDDSLTRIHITARIRLWNIWGRFFIPIFFTPLFLFGVWQPLPIRILELILLYGLAWMSYRYSAAIDAHDMVYFIEKVLEDFMPKSVSELSSHVPHVVDNREDFPDAWEKFYESHVDD